MLLESIAVALTLLEISDLRFSANQASPPSSKSAVDAQWEPATNETFLAWRTLVDLRGIAYLMPLVEDRLELDLTIPASFLHQTSLIEPDEFVQQIGFDRNDPCNTIIVQEGYFCRDGVITSFFAEDPLPFNVEPNDPCLRMYIPEGAICDSGVIYKPNEDLQTALTFDPNDICLRADLVDGAICRDGVITAQPWDQSEDLFAFEFNDPCRYIMPVPGRDCEGGTIFNGPEIDDDEASTGGDDVDANDDVDGNSDSHETDTEAGETETLDEKADAGAAESAGGDESAAAEEESPPAEMSNEEGVRSVKAADEPESDVVDDGWEVEGGRDGLVIGPALGGAGLLVNTATGDVGGRLAPHNFLPYGVGWSVESWRDSGTYVSVGASVFFGAASIDLSSPVSFSPEVSVTVRVLGVQREVLRASPPSESRNGDATEPDRTP